MPSKPDAATGALIAVDWGTSRLRAMLIGPNGRVLTEAESDDGIGALKPGDPQRVSPANMGPDLRGVTPVTPAPAVASESAYRGASWT